MRNVPQAKQVAHKTYCHEESRVDYYHWMRDSGWPVVSDKEVLKHLETEKAYYKAATKEQKPLIKKLFKELKSRVVLADKTVPIKKGNYYYFQYTKARLNYPIYARRRNGSKKPEILLDPNKLVSRSAYLKLGGVDVSEDHQKLAYSFENDGSERFMLHIKQLEGSEAANEEVLKDVGGQVVWDNDSKGFYYIKLDQNWKRLEVYYHLLDTEQSADRLIYHEEDTAFEVDIKKSASRQFCFISSTSSDTSEVWYIDLLKTTSKLKLLKARWVGCLYNPEHYQDYFYFYTNDNAKNFRITKQKIVAVSGEDWLEVIATSDKQYLTGFYFAEKFYVVMATVEGLAKFYVYNYQDEMINDVQFQDPCYAASLIKLTYNDEQIRIEYSALNRPESILDYHYLKNQPKVVKIYKIPSRFNQELYVSERLHVTSWDGKQIPLSVVYRKDLVKKDGNNPLYLYGYGAYGYSFAPSFQRNILSLLDRGIIYAIAHVRGGDELGRSWYEDGRLLNKRNTFNDFEDCLKFMIKEKYTKEKKVIISGTSAGGMIIGYGLNEFSELLGGAVAKVPFVDVVNTMLDETLPLTQLEYTEWGNPKQKEYYDYIKGYSAYDNIKSKEYPPIYVTAGLNDPRVTYWEPAKWVAKLREYKTDANQVLFNISFGHGGNSGRFGYLEDIAEEYSFVLNALNMNV